MPPTESSSELYTANQMEELANRVVIECAALLYKHADALTSYKFTDRAYTANSCAGMILEHFGLKDTYDRS